MYCPFIVLAEVLPVISSDDLVVAERLGSEPADGATNMSLNCLKLVLC